MESLLVVNEPSIARLHWKLNYVNFTYIKFICPIINNDLIVEHEADQLHLPLACKDISFYEPLALAAWWTRQTLLECPSSYSVGMQLMQASLENAGSAAGSGPAGKELKLVSACCIKDDTWAALQPGGVAASVLRSFPFHDS
eukprot:1137192-Pelagomonas_calceolata.AAC.4